jgi:hypothetical protein
MNGSVDVALAPVPKQSFGQACVYRALRLAPCNLQSLVADAGHKAQGFWFALPLVFLFTLLYGIGSHR